MENTMETGNAIGNISSIKTSDGQIGVKGDTSPFAECLYFQDFYNESAVKRFIKNVEKLIRTSREYDEYIGLLRTNVSALNHDNILLNVTTGDVDLEFHHYPFTLYEIVTIVINAHVIDGSKFTSFSIAKEVMGLHYEHIIGLVPLTKTMHELAHDGKLFLSTKQIFGNYKEFMNRYNRGLTMEQKNAIKEIEDLSTNNTPCDIGGLL